MKKLILILLVLCAGAHDNHAVSKLNVAVVSGIIVYAGYNLVQHYTTTRIGILPIAGAIDGHMAGKSLEKIHRFMEDSSIKGVLLVIDSGGGSAGVSEVVAREIKLLSETKPV